MLDADSNVLPKNCLASILGAFHDMLHHYGQSSQSFYYCNQTSRREQSIRAARCKWCDIRGIRGDAGFIWMNTCMGRNWNDLPQHILVHRIRTSWHQLHSNFLTGLPAYTTFVRPRLIWTCHLVWTGSLYCGKHCCLQLMFTALQLRHPSVHIHPPTCIKVTRWKFSVFAHCCCDFKICIMFYCWHSWLGHVYPSLHRQSYKATAGAKANLFFASQTSPYEPPPRYLIVSYTSSPFKGLSLTSFMAWGMLTRPARNAVHKPSSHAGACSPSEHNTAQAKG